MQTIEAIPTKRKLPPEVIEALRENTEFLHHLPAEWIEKLVTQYYISPQMDLLPQRILDSLTLIGVEDGKLLPLMQVTNPNLVDTRWKPQNLDFMELWEQQHLKLSVNMTHGFLSFMTHGLEAQLKQAAGAYITQPLKPYDVDNLLSILIAKHYAQREDSWRWKKGKIPEALYLAKNIRKKAQKHYDQFRAIERGKRKRDREERNARIYP